MTLVRTAKEKYFAQISEGIDTSNIPAHIAAIMDGNRRWAKKNKLPGLMGHNKGVQTFKKLVKLCSWLGVKYFTVYAFSTENWQRAAKEVKVLMGLFKYYCQNERKELKKSNVRFQLIGDLEIFTDDIKKEFLKTLDFTKDCTGLTINLAVNYGSRNEIIHAVKNIAHFVKDGSVDIDAINDELFSQSLYTKDMPDPDLLIRTSGEIRISNYLLWQIAYSELYFTNILWPDFDEKALITAIKDWQSRQRRFGK